jgi:hypothetical protein
MTESLAETYSNTYAIHNRVCRRYWVHPKVMVGGNVLDAADWKHLQDTYSIASVLNVDGISDVGKGISHLSECHVEDDGTPFPRHIVRQAVSFAKLTTGFGPIYVHCHLGISRSPAFAYAILRWVFEQSPEEALKAIRASAGEWGQGYGTSGIHISYINSIEKAFIV